MIVLTLHDEDAVELLRALYTNRPPQGAPSHYQNPKLDHIIAALKCALNVCDCNRRPSDA